MQLSRIFFILDLSFDQFFILKYFRLFTSPLLLADNDALSKLNNDLFIPSLVSNEFSISEQSISVLNDLYGYFVIQTRFL